LKIGDGEVLRASFITTPLHDQSVRDATVHPKNQNAFVALDTAAVAVQGDIQLLMQAALEGPGLGGKGAAILGLPTRRAGRW
jgi:uncharacterized protein (DUF2342 family)